MYEQFEDIVTLEELCEMLGIGKNAAYRLLSSGHVKAFRINRVWKIPKQAVIEYVLKESKLVKI